MKTHRECPKCHALVHVKRNPCTCGYVWVKGLRTPGVGSVVPQSFPALRKAINGPTVKPTKTVKHTDDVTEQTDVPISSASNPKDVAKLTRRVEELQNHIEVLERETAKSVKFFEETARSIELKFRKFYNYQAQLIYQRAWEHFGGKGDLYHSVEHGDNPKLFKALSDETGVFIAPKLPDYPSLNDVEPTDEVIQGVAESVLHMRTPSERDLEMPGVVIEDPMSIPYANADYAKAISEVNTIIEEVCEKTYPIA